MIQGTGSGVGKSLLTAAFCRYFYQAGYKVAPFKAQNMALNSFVTERGEEMGRAQVYQAEACGLKPEVLMNPILLKPSGDNNSQVIVMGKPDGSRNAKDFYARHLRHKEIVTQALAELRSKYEMVIIEGAGSPAEINLKQWDLVNMFIAEKAEAPVLIVGDIDKGGVFAWFKGTYDLLSKTEQDRVIGFIINKFRGDRDLLQPGIEQFEEMIGKPVFGVLPYIRDMVVDEEDSLPQRFYSAENDAQGVLNVAVIELPRISNFTDLSPLAYDPSISLQYIQHPSQLGNPDLIILPGSKNTVDDMNSLNQQCLTREILKCHEAGTMILGICGGFQMLGEKIKDPEYLESRERETDGLGLFDFETTLVAEKLTRQVQLETVKSRVFPEGLQCEGYEIHMGRTTFRTTYPALFSASNSDDPMNFGIINQAGTVFGTYLHGFLDNDLFRENILRYIRNAKGLPEPKNKFDYAQFRTRELDKLADLVKTSINMEAIERKL
ncbi:MAG: cobyric acid synthase [Nitrospinae bacterium]|nr:cobyric acid synthase [Nitrospinota bacterium]MBL7020436.1 cobyric acid synthase [Nitrospinaceae bacterium]